MHLLLLESREAAHITSGFCELPEVSRWIMPMKQTGQLSYRTRPLLPVEAIVQNQTNLISQLKLM